MTFENNIKNSSSDEVGQYNEITSPEDVKDGEYNEITSPEAVENPEVLNRVYKRKKAKVKKEEE